MYHSLGEISKAREMHEKHLQIAERLGDLSGQGKAYGGPLPSQGKEETTKEHQTKQSTTTQNKATHSQERFGDAVRGAGMTR